MSATKYVHRRLSLRQSPLRGRGRPRHGHGRATARSARRPAASSPSCPRKKFNLLSGDDALSDYQFNKHVIHHLFSRRAASDPSPREDADGTEMRAINVRRPRASRWTSSRVNHFDGRSR